MFCPHCGNNRTPDQLVCTSCGKELPRLAASGVADSASATLIGRTLDKKYRLDAMLGVDLTGTVYRATRLFIGDVVVIKILDPDLTNNQRAVERFYREARTSALIKHPNAVATYDFAVSSDKLVYLVTELVDGVSLRKRLEQPGGLPQESVVKIATQVCAALAEAHKHGVVHRDLNPGNILIQNTGIGQQVKVLNFGIAALRDINKSDADESSDPLRSAEYMSPEQCRGESLDSRSDIYSLGVVLYELLTGVTPFNSPVLTAVVVRQVNEQPRPLRDLNANISPAIESVVLRALEKRRELRPQTASEFASWLTEAAKGVNPIHVAVTAKSLASSTVSNLAQPLRDPRSYDTTEEKLPQDAEAPAPRRSSKLALGMVSAALLMALGLGGIWWYIKSVGAKPATDTPAAVDPAKPTTPAPSTVPSTSPSTAEKPVPPPLPVTASSLWELLPQDTNGATDAANALGAPDQKLAVIAPGKQIALVYRDGQFFGNGPGSDLRLHGPDGQPVSYTVLVRTDSVAAWRQVDVNRRGFTNGVFSHDIGHHGVQQAKQVMIKNDGKLDLKLDAVTAVYKDTLFSAAKPAPKPVAKPVRKPAPKPRPYVDPKEAEKQRKKREKELKKRNEKSSTVLRYERRYSKDSAK